MKKIQLSLYSSFFVLSLLPLAVAAQTQYPEETFALAVKWVSAIIAVAVVIGIILAIKLLKKTAKLIVAIVLVILLLFCGAVYAYAHWGMQVISSDALPTMQK